MRPSRPAPRRERQAAQALKVSGAIRAGFLDH